MLERGTRRAAFAAAIGLVLSTTALSPALAQEEAQFDSAVDLNLFDYATGLHTFLTVPDADVMGDKQFNLDFLITFLTDPLTVYNVDPAGNDDFDIAENNPERTRVVENIVAAILGGSFGFHDKYELGVALPMTINMNGQGLNITDAMSGPDLKAAGLGDLRAEFKWRFWQKENLRLAAIPGITLPTSFGKEPDGAALEDGGLLGDNLPTGRIRAAVQWNDRAGNLHLGGYLGAIFRKPRTLYSSEVGQQWTWGAAGAFRITDKVDAIAEAFGRSGFNTNLDASPVELNGAVRVQATEQFSVVAGGGAGVLKGIGSPGLRAFVSVGWAPDFRDSDDDGIRNDKDQCPLLAEDKDGYEDADGCPDNDNDGDRRDDSIDKCPNEAEDLDGFEDDDGCPEPDNDNDGLLDPDDRCPTFPEDGKPPFDKDGCPADKRDSDDDGTFDAYDQCPDEPEDLDDFEDWDGCPDVDNDGDDIPDEFDECPLCAEDKDGFADDDGCPEIDNDNDGVPDGADQCSDEAEVINGLDDFDGCPDDGGVLLVTLDGDRMSIDGDIGFRRRRNTLTSKGEVYADQIAATMLAHPEVALWRVVVVVNQNRFEQSDAQARADAIKSQAVSRGVNASKIEAVGAAADRDTVAVVVLERAAVDEDGKICPAGAKAVERERPAEPVPVQTEAGAAPEPEAEAAPEPEPEPEPEPATVPSEFDEYAGVVDKVRFRRNKDKMRSGSTRTLDAIAELLLKHTHVTVEVKAHTDSRKGPDKSKEITQAQADVVKAYLVEKGVPEERVIATGAGMDEPIGDNKKSSGRQQNRRIEFSFSATK